MAGEPVIYKHSSHVKLRSSPMENNLKLPPSSPGPLFTKRTDVLPQEVSKSRNSVQTFAIARQQCCWDGYQISEQHDHCSIQSHGFETSRVFAIRRLTAQWMDALDFNTHVVHLLCPEYSGEHQEGWCLGYNTAYSRIDTNLDMCIINNMTFHEVIFRGDEFYSVPCMYFVVIYQFD